MIFSINKLSELTGKDRRTITKRLGTIKKTADGYETSEALALIYGAVSKGEIKLDPQQEAARLNQARTEKVEIETKVIKGELCKTSDVQAIWSALVSNVRAKLLAMPSRLAHIVLAAADYAEAEELIKSSVREALEELAGDPIPEHELRSSIEAESDG